MIDITNKILIPAVLAIITALIGLVIWIFQQHYKREEEKKKADIEAYRQKREKEEKKRDEYMIILIKMVGASIALGEANSVALQNGKCNGETHKALDYAQKVKRENREYLTRLGVESIF